MTSPVAQPDGRVAVITGAASGFGRELATQCAALRMRLVLADLDLAGLDATRALAGLDFMARTRTTMKSGRLTATDVARLTLAAVRQERFYVFTHPRAIGGVEQRLRDIVQGHSPTNPLGSAP